VRCSDTSGLGVQLGRRGAVCGASSFGLRQFRQLGDVGYNAPGLVAGEQLRRCASARLILEIGEGECLPVSVADDEAGGRLLDGPGRQLALKAPHQ
jgi:hypothetical protein